MAITYPQELDGGIDSGLTATNRTKQFTSNITAGALLLAEFSTYSADPALISINDDKGNTWNLIGRALEAGTGRGCASYWARANVASVGSMPVITFNKNSITCVLGCSITEALGVHADVLDAAMVSANAVNGGPAQVTLGATAFTDNSIRAVLSTPGTSWVTATPNAGWTDAVSNNLTGVVQHKVQRRAVTSAGVYTPGWTLNNTSQWAVVGYALKGSTTAPTLTDISTATPRNGSLVTFTGVNLGASEGTLEIEGEAQDIDTWADDEVSINFDIGTHLYGTQLDVVLTTSTAIVSNTFTGLTGALPELGHGYVTLTSIEADVDKRLEALVDLEIGFQVEFEELDGDAEVFENATFKGYQTATSFDARARDADGWGDWATQQLISATAPVVTSGGTASGNVGIAFAGYQITATNSPDSFNATGLPPGLSVNTGTGYISGTPTSSGEYHATISATNEDGMGSKSLVITIAVEAPEITSTLTASGTTGVVFAGYQITASNSPTSYNATSLPPGLSVNTSTGAITGTPTLNGTFNTTISATNITGTGSDTLVFTISLSPATPVPERTGKRSATNHIARRTSINRIGKR